MHTDTAPKLPAKPTGRRYASIKALMANEGVSSEVQQRVAELEKETRVARQLACMRTAAGLTQEQMAEKLEVTQGCISKYESGSDEDLTLATIREYCRATDQRVGVLVGKPYTHVEAIKIHFQGLRHHFDALAALGQGEGDLEQSVQSFFGEALFNLLGIFEKIQEKGANGSSFEIQVVHDAPKGKSLKKTCKTETTVLTPIVV